MTVAHRPAGTEFWQGTGRTEGASSGDGAGRVAVVEPSSQERGPCGLPAQRAERPAERVRGALPSSLASLPTYVQRADRVLANDNIAVHGSHAAGPSSTLGE